MLADVIIKAAGMEKHKRGMYYPRPSSSGPDRCIRQMVYHGRQIPEDTQMADRMVLTLDDSSWHEHLTADWIQKTAYRLNSQQMPIDIQILPFMPVPISLDRPFEWDDPEQPEIPSSEYVEYLFSRNYKWCRDCRKPIPLNIYHGHIDGVVTDMLEVDRHYEHKALNHFTWQRLASGEAPKDYIAQCCDYVFGLQKVNPSIRESILLVKNKMTAQYLEYVIDYDSEKDSAVIKGISVSYGEVTQIGEVFENIRSSSINKFAEIQKHIVAGTIPARPFEFGTEFPCSYCSWRDTCWSTYADEVQAISANEADLNEIADTARLYKELGGHISDMKDQQDEIRNSIILKLHEHNSRHGKAGEYDIELKLSKRKGYTVKDSMYEQLRINKLKGGSK